MAGYCRDYPFSCDNVFASPPHNTAVRVVDWLRLCRRTR